MFDTIFAKCPKCGTESEFQSKSGDCFLAVYPLSECPSEVLVNVNRHAPQICEKCGTSFGVQLFETLSTCTHCKHRERKITGQSRKWGDIIMPMITYDNGTT